MSADEPPKAYRPPRKKIVYDIERSKYTREPTERLKISIAAFMKIFKKSWCFQPQRAVGFDRIAYEAGGGGGGTDGTRVHERGTPTFI